MLTLTVTDKREIADDIFLFELRDRNGETLPPFTAGAHLLVHTPAGIARRYSLCNAPAERDRYVIAVKRDAAGGGGSLSMARDVNAGTTLNVSSPLNYFPLANDASRYLLIAGGIGITPMRAMMAELAARNAPFDVIYCTRAPESTAFLDEFSAAELAHKVRVHHDFGDRAQSIAIEPLVAERHGNTHIYCCGPRPLMQAVRDATAHWPSSAVHFEDFGTSSHENAAGEKAFTVRLARSGGCVNVAPGESILDALRANGIDTPSSCEAGTCGSCRTRLLAGEADHRDFVLDEDEQESEIMICVSRACSNELVLDI
ncbi:PDR/VanB family oxidoreductase [Caballeronia insecticola]|uniref:Phthalate 4,5-dioxygenase reductase subunit n=1 Tax=Caballeronia insecticola TaxID=758793 RepID=R4X4G8_9BURK|nr:PDR/VanB family oxidoreductase [Caballeronia insecticola]BAN27292.1 phthalate 4,5-dioxygenase reductase subunit [Caballeronia insecticola]